MLYPRIKAAAGVCLSALLLASGLRSGRGDVVLVGGAFLALVGVPLAFDVRFH